MMRESNWRRKRRSTIDILDIFFSNNNFWCFWTFLFFFSFFFSRKKSLQFRWISLLSLILGKIHFKVFPWFSIYLYHLYVSYWKFHNISTSFVGSLKQETRVVILLSFQTWLLFASLPVFISGIRKSKQ